MKKITLFVALLFGFTVFSQNDTTSFTTNKVQLDWEGNFDSQVEFPDGTDSYRQIIMTLELGQYNCDPGEQYCHQWDYDTEIELVDDNNETYELGRFITPFATSGWSRFGSNWKQPYIFDVTDFYPLLKNEKTIRIHYSGYSGGFTAKIKFDFIEGTPPREVLGIKKAYQTNHNYGDANDPFNDYLPTFTDTPPAGTKSADLKILVTGHGSDNNQCCEFMSHSYDLSLNGSQIATKDVWRNDCGSNDLYPQGGTWVYDRSNWCPGAKVEPIIHELFVADSSSFNLDVQFENYTGSGDLGLYKFNGIVFYYGETNNNVDAAITDIISPTNDPNHYRANPSGSKPQVEVRNTGNTAITSIEFNYGINGANSENYTWSGNLAPQETKVIELDELADLLNLSLNEKNGTQEFQVEIATVNGQADDLEDNNSMTSQFEVAPKWPSAIHVKMKTSNLGANGGLNSNPADASWEITDMAGNVVASRTNANVKTQYDDYVGISDTGMYKFKIKAINCYGLNWWALPNSFTPGNLKITGPDGSLIPMKNYAYTGQAHDDFGCEYVAYFSVDSQDADVKEFAKNDFKIYPNPARGYINLDLGENANMPFQISLHDLQGRTVYSTTSNTNQTQIPVSQLSDGVYFLNFKDSNNTKHVEKVIVTK